MTTAKDELIVFSEKVKKADLPDGLKESLLLRLDQLQSLVESPTFLPEFDSMTKYVDWVLSLPWNIRTQDVLDIDKAKQVLDKNHFGLSIIKDRILEYVSVMKIKQEKGEGKEVFRAPILCFVGLVGTGKTTIASSIAEAMGRNFARIPFGGMGDPLELRGQSRIHSEAEPGKIIKALRTTQAKNSVILLDEIDRVTEQGRAALMGVLVELLDPEQNKAFTDHYIGYPFDLSEVLFVATANNTLNISTAVLDRIEPIQMPSYSDSEKITIGKTYMLPKIVKAAGIPEDSIVIDDNVWSQIVRPLGYDAGMRTLERTIEGVVRKIARQIIEGKGQSFKLTSENIKELLPQL